MNKINRLFSWLLVVAMLTGMSPAGAAADTNVPETERRGTLAERREDAVIAEAEPEQPLKKTGYFSWDRSFEKSEKTNWTYHYDYDESWFLIGSDTYQHDLTKMSLRLAMAACGTNDGVNTYTEQNIKALYADLEFSDPVFHYPEPAYDTTGDNDTIGYAIASKNIAVEGGEPFSLLVVAVRGGGYGVEWGPNFKMGTGDTHRGFAIARDQVLQGIEDYIAAYGDKLSGNCKIWLAGYSRAAATTNLVAKELIDGALDGAALDPEDIYAFCFGCPQTSRASDVSSGKYKNIINVANANDFVTKVAMSAWGYGRYGTTLFVPYLAEEKEDYAQLHEAMQERYLDIGASNEFTIDWGELGEPYPETQPSTLDTFMDLLANCFGDQETYATNGSQEILVDLAAQSLGGSEMSPLDFFLGLLGIPEINEMFWREQSVSEEVIGLFSSNAAISAHYPELCLAWLDSLGEEFGGYEDGTVLLGDVNNDGAVTGTDTNLIFRHVSGTQDFTDEQMKAADMNGDGAVTGTDTNLVFRLVSGALDILE